MHPGPDYQSLTFEQHPPNIKPSIAPTASHCGIVSINMRPAIANIFEDALRVSSMPYISAFSRDGAALMTFGIMTSPSVPVAVVDWRSRRVDLRRAVVIGLDCVVLLESALRFFVPIVLSC